MKSDIFNMIFLQPGVSLFQLYYAEYAFSARTENEVSLFEHQVVTVIAAHDENGNTEWWYVEADGMFGYAPAAYLRPMDTTWRSHSHNMAA